MTRIAVVEDEQDYREMLVVWLTPRYFVSGFKSGEELLEAFKRQDFDLIITDMNMPEMSGIVLVEHIRSSVSRTIPALGLTANFDAGSRESMLKAGFTEYLSKLITLDELDAHIDALLVVRSMTFKGGCSEK
jgi:CheY-like chemotaxis protein